MLLTPGFFWALSLESLIAWTWFWARSQYCLGQAFSPSGSCAHLQQEWAQWRALRLLQSCTFRTLLRGPTAVKKPHFGGGGSWLAWMATFTCSQWRAQWVLGPLKSSCWQLATSDTDSTVTVTIAQSHKFGEGTLHRPWSPAYSRQADQIPAEQVSLLLTLLFSPRQLQCAVMDWWPLPVPHSSGKSE